MPPAAYGLEASFRARRSARGYTLAEVLVAASLLVIISTGLLTLLTQGIRIWRTSEMRGLAYERARAALDQICEDLRCAIARAPGSTEAGWVRWVCDLSPQGRQRLRFLRSTPSETAHSLLREGGKYLLERTPAAYDGIADRAEAEAGLLAAPAGSMEILYMLDPRPGETTLWRAVRAPAGGAGSLFLDGPLDSSGDRFPLQDFASPIARDVLYVGFRFWGPTTNTWEDVPPLSEPSEHRASGPTREWDSTRALLDSAAQPGWFAWRRVPGSLDDPTDDIFPERVEVTLVVRGEYNRSEVRLAAPLGERDETMRIAGTFELPEDPSDRFVRIEDEWIRVADCAPGSIAVAKDGRGERGTQAAKHEAGALLEQGVTFRRYVEIPSGGRAWLEAQFRMTKQRSR